ncbi:MAG: hypothetical protein H6766_02720 [Candidatus Peribacteria bacterium]|nr:MAG: hypothetical protein H6766_02720 [Candidatus Peribacteria bacterium]
MTYTVCGKGESDSCHNPIAITFKSSYTTERVYIRRAEGGRTLADEAGPTLHFLPPIGSLYHPVVGHTGSLSEREMIANDLFFLDGDYSIVTTFFFVKNSQTFFGLFSPFDEHPLAKYLLSCIERVKEGERGL